MNTEKLFQAGYEIPDTYEALIQTARQIQANGETAFLFPDGENWSVRMSLEGIETAMREVLRISGSRWLWEIRIFRRIPLHWKPYEG